MTAFELDIAEVTVKLHIDHASSRRMAIDDRALARDADTAREHRYGSAGARWICASVLEAPVGETTYTCV